MVLKEHVRPPAFLSGCSLCTLRLFVGNSCSFNLCQRCGVKEHATREETCSCWHTGRKTPLVNPFVQNWLILSIVRICAELIQNLQPRKCFSPQLRGSKFGPLELTRLPIPDVRPPSKGEHTSLPSFYCFLCLYQKKAHQRAFTCDPKHPGQTQSKTMQDRGSGKRALDRCR